LKNLDGRIEETPGPAEARALHAGQRIQAVTFDAGGTLIEPWPSVGHIYAEVAARFGLRAEPARLNRQFAGAWRAKRGFDYSRAAWLDLVERSFAGVAEPLPEGYFAAVYERFAEPDAWRVFDDVPPTLDLLAKRGVRLAVVSNWDERLEPLLERLNLRRHFEAVVVSCHAGFTKPSREIFRRAAEQLALEPDAILHIGDGRTEDVGGRRAARTAGSPERAGGRGRTSPLVG
jgi:putative hydrolase of the HAD superfamily